MISKQKSVAIMQPYFFPYLGYFSLIHAADHWVFFDEVQFIRHGWIERNRVLNSNKTPSYIKVAIKKHSRETSIKDAKINHNVDWRKKIFDQLTCYKKRASYYSDTVDFLKNALSPNFNTISELNIHLIKKVCAHIGIPFTYDVLSNMNFDIKNNISHPGQWALEITKQINGCSYINPPGGIDLFIPDEFKKEKINLFCCENHLTSYTQFSETFIKGLSIIDVLMFNSKGETLELIKDYKLNEK